jgi:dihydrofolate synthase / folylpolyglutamate synthase
MTSDYQERLDYLHNLLNYEWQGMPRVPADLTLRRMRRLLHRLGDPQAGLPIIHIAGTKGKGSTAVMIAAALTASGVRTGLYCSPHLNHLEERFTIDGEPASAAELVDLVDDVREAAERLEIEDPLHGDRRSTFFEITTAMGLLHFARRGVGAVVLEVGMGGRLDSTNVVHPVFSIITSISYDHTRQLGNTLGLIATEKAGILKRGRPGVSGVDSGEAQQSIRRVASQRRCRLHELGTDFAFEIIPPELPLIRPAPCRVSVRTWRSDWGTLSLPLLGPHQAHNAAVAMAGFDVLAEERPGLTVNRDDVVRGFAALKWPARVEILGQRPWLVIDGAHNAASAVALVETLRMCFPLSRRTLVFGTTREKDLRGQLLALLPWFDEVIATRYLENPRSMPTETIAAAGLMLTGQTIRTSDHPAEALELARRLTAPDELICVTGSLFLAAEVRALVSRHEAVPMIGGVVF